MLTLRLALETKSPLADPELFVARQRHPLQPVERSPAHQSDEFAELVCSNSLRSNQPSHPVGLLKEEMRRLGSLVMAKRTPPSTTGAQFFIVTGPDGEALTNKYSLFGQVTEGLDVVQAISDLPTDERDFPTEDIIVNTVTIAEG